jgi:CubicO group peptidase (beta-lactamase class C family)
MDLYQVPGVSVAVFNDFELDYVEVHGVKDVTTREPVTEGTLFQAASMSKSVAAAGVLRLAEEGGVSLDAAINVYLASWQLPYNSLQESEAVTLRRLLSHTAGTTVSGFRGYRYTEPIPSLIQILEGAPPANSAPVVVELVPGSRFQYSGGGYLVAQQAVEDVTGLSFPEFIHARVLEPTGMSSSTFEQPLPPAKSSEPASGYYADGTAVPGGHHVYPEIAAGGLWATSADVARFLVEIQRSLAGISDDVLRQESAVTMVTEVMRDYSLGFDLWEYGGERYFGHSGANDGFRGRMLAHRSDGFGVVILTNSDNGLELAGAIVRVIGDREGWPGF